MATDSSNEERKALLGNQNQPNSSGHSNTRYNTNVVASPHSADPSALNNIVGSNEVWLSSTDDELPPPYTPSTHGSAPTVNCKVCQALIYLQGRTSNHVVKCDQCHEATPIRPAPPGKKYVRCMCNCLLICKSDARRVMCPRPTCKRVILFGDQTARAAPDVTNTRIICAHCNQTFLFNLTNRALARCPHCRRISSIGRAYSLKRARIFLTISIIFLIIAIIVTSLTGSGVEFHRGIIAAYVFLFACTLCCMLRALYYFNIKGSQVDMEA